MSNSIDFGVITVWPDAKVGERYSQSFPLTITDPIISVSTIFPTPNWVNVELNNAGDELTISGWPALDGDFELTIGNVISGVTVIPFDDPSDGNALHVIAADTINISETTTFVRGKLLVPAGSVMKVTVDDVERPDLTVTNLSAEGILMTCNMQAVPAGPEPTFSSVPDTAIHAGQLYIYAS